MNAPSCRRLAPPNEGWPGAAWWRLDLDALDAQGASDTGFADFERQRLARLRFARDARRYRAAHWGLRQVLGHCLDLPAEVVHLAEDAQGKPFVCTPGALEFSLSHSGAVAVVAVSSGPAVGVDVEVLRALPDREALARTCLGEAECQDWARIPEAERDLALLVAWTRKEAALKALGCGLLGPELPDVPAGLSGAAGAWSPEPGWGAVRWAGTLQDADCVISLAWVEP